MPLTFRQLQAEVEIWVRRNFPNNTPREPFEGMVEELGELAHARLKGRQGIRGTAAEHEAAEKDAVADILIYACDFCSKSNLCLETVVLSGLMDAPDDSSIATIQMQAAHDDEAPDDRGAFDLILYYLGAVTDFPECVGSVIYGLADYCHHRGFDLSAIVEETWNQVKARDWRNDPANGVAPSSITDEEFSYERI